MNNSKKLAVTMIAILVCVFSPLSAIRPTEKMRQMMKNLDSLETQLAAIDTQALSTTSKSIENKQIQENVGKIAIIKDLLQNLLKQQRNDLKNYDL